MLTSTSRRPDTATTSPAQDRVRPELEDLTVTANAFDEHAGVRKHRFGLDDPADELAVRGDLIGAHLELAPRRFHPAGRGALGHLGLVALALGQIDPEQLGAEESEDPAGADRAEEVGDGVGHRDAVDLGLGLLGGKPSWLIVSVATPIDAEMVCAPAFSPAARPGP